MLLALLFSFATSSFGATLSLPPAAPVVDEYHLLSSREDANLDELVRGIKQKSGVEITVFIPATLQDLPIEDFAIGVARQWGLGRKKEDRGLLMVIAPRERQMRLEVGGGLEGDVTDVFARHVLNDGMRPFFRQGRYYDGILNSLLRLQEKIPLGLSPAEAPSSPVDRKHYESIQMLILFLAVMFGLFLLILIGGRNKGYYGGGGIGNDGWSGGGSSGGGVSDGGSSGGGSWGGGDGGFSGGGSSSSW